MSVFWLRILTFICLNVNIVMVFLTPARADDHKDFALTFAVMSNPGDTPDKGFRTVVNELMGESPTLTELSGQGYQPEPGDVVVNEVLFNPYSGGCDFVEILNWSAKPIDTRFLVLAGRDSKGELRQRINLGATQMVLEPGDILAVCISKEGVTSFYASECEACICEIPSMPAMNNAEGWAVLLDSEDQVIDELHYTEEMHHSLIRDVKGVSIERVNPGLPASHKGNLQSASAAAGFATPGCKNSQVMTEALHRVSLDLENAAFSPNDDGYKDELVIRYKMPATGWVANGWIFDLSGGQKARIAGNLLLSTEGELLWKGDDQTGSRLPPGPYVLMLEMYDLEGHVERFREAVVLTDRWE